VQLIPEVMKAFRTHHLKDISWAMLTLMLISSTLWVLYGIGIATIPLIISAGMNFLFETMLAVLKVRYDKRRKRALRTAVQKAPVNIKD